MKHKERHEPMESFPALWCLAASSWQQGSASWSGNTKISSPYQLQATFFVSEEADMVQWSKTVKPPAVPV